MEKREWYASAVVAAFSFFMMGMAIISDFAAPTHARSLEEIRQSKDIRICIASAHPSYAVSEPEGCREHCTFRGPVYEAALAFASTLGNDITPTFLRVEWDEQFFNREGKTVREASYTPELLASGTCDVYPTHLTKLPWRQKKLDFVILFASRMMVVVHKSKKNRFKTPADLAGKVAAVEKDTSYHTWLQEQNASAYAANPVHIQLMGADASIKAVDAGQVDFTLLDADSSIWVVRHQVKNAVVVFPVGPTDEIGWAFRKEDKDLQAAVQQFFETQKATATSTLNAIWEKAFGLTLTRFESLVRATP